MILANVKCFCVHVYNGQSVYRYKSIKMKQENIYCPDDLYFG